MTQLLIGAWAILMLVGVLAIAGGAQRLAAHHEKFPPEESEQDLERITRPAPPSVAVWEDFREGDMLYVRMGNLNELVFAQFRVTNAAIDDETGQGVYMIEPVVE